MGMFDYYVPAPSLSCPVCGKEVKEWQGKDGPCVLESFTQGQPVPLGPIDLEWDFVGVSPPEPPTTFEMHAVCCGLIEAEGELEDGVWVRTGHPRPYQSVGDPNR